MAPRPARADVLDDILGSAAAPSSRATGDDRDARASKSSEPRQYREPEEPTQARKPKDSVRRARMNVEIPEELAAKVRDTVIALSGPPVRLTLARFAEEAFRREVERLRAEHHRGQPFPATDRVVRVGRPVGTGGR
jgi:hypothetical protein